MGSELLSIRVEKARVTRYREALEQAEKAQGMPTSGSRESSAQLADRALAVATEVSSPSSEWKKRQIGHTVEMAKSVAVAAVANFAARLMAEGSLPEGDLEVHFNMSEGLLTVTVKHAGISVQYKAPTKGIRMVERDGRVTMETVVGRISPAMWKRRSKGASRLSNGKSGGEKTNPGKPTLDDESND